MTWSIQTFFIVAVCLQSNHVVVMSFLLHQLFVVPTFDYLAVFEHVDDVHIPDG